MIGSKKYVNSVLIENKKDCELIAATEGYGAVNPNVDTYFPLVATIPKRRNLIQALKKSWYFSKMGLFNLVLKQG